jgi:hypothetical protein
MRGDQLARQWRVTRAIEASPNELTAAEIARLVGVRETIWKRSALEACSKNWNGLFCYVGPKPVVYQVFFLNGRTSWEEAIR